MSMVLATTWVRRGVAAQFPTKYDIDEVELGRISKLARLQLEDAQEDLNIARGTADTDTDSEDNSDVARPSNGTAIPPPHEDDDLAEYNLDAYDDDPTDEHGEKFAMFGNANSLAYHAPNEKDPYLVLPEGEDEDEEEREELQILPEDNLLLAAKVEDEVAHLEVCVYEDEADNLYVHHDIMLPAIPLCVEWIDVPVGKGALSRTQGNFVAVGTHESRDRDLGPRCGRQHVPKCNPWPRTRKFCRCRRETERQKKEETGGKHAESQRELSRRCRISSGCEQTASKPAGFRIGR